MSKEENNNITENKPDDEAEVNKTEENVEAEFLGKLPPEARKVVEFGMSMQRVGPMPNPIVEKLNEGHIDKILEIAAKDDERSFADAGSSRKYTLVYIVIFVALFIFLTIFLVGSDIELYKEIIKIFIVFLGGLGSGFGIKTYMDKNR